MFSQTSSLEFNSLACSISPHPQFARANAASPQGEEIYYSAALTSSRISLSNNWPCFLLAIKSRALA